MSIFVTGVAMFVVGSLLNGIGWQIHRRSIQSSEAMTDWFVEVLKHWFGKLTGPDSTGGERLAAFGSIIAALGLVVAVAGLISWAA